MLAAGLNAKNIVCINFLYLAKNWPTLIRYWTQVDLIFLLPPYEPLKWTIRKKLKFLNGMFTVIWNFPDFFIILISLGLSTRFQQFATRIQTLTGRFVPDSLWCELRQHHIKLCELMEYVDEQLSNIVLISALNNMYFICNKLLNIFSKQRWPINYIYFWFSLIFLLTRSAGVFLFAAKIHDASLLPLKTLYLVPRSCWSEEVQRFTSQITDECIALSGKRFFFVTRKSLFGLVATIVTYEFMLLQFDANNRKLGLPDLCGFVKSNLTQKA
ncbi:gustatory receptor for sugar taste 61a [Teleopsis dalmanni]|uniref:gustatory receptor for sugar taste 61a n=1 Tax=Teleopsis dalmanni TaxID=139649 RepID=UPI0018CE2F0B|nr:gustatory receptor for sugar taste 61a [Teleopsis dalmanni]